MTKTIETDLVIMNVSDSWLGENKNTVSYEAEQAHLKSKREKAH